MKHLKRLILLGLLGLVGFGSQPAAAQTRGVRIGLNIENVQFFVDGQLYSRTQFFLWQQGSVHTVQFPHTREPDGTISPYQYYDSNTIRYRFQGWTGTGVQLDGDPVQRIVVGSQAISITGNVGVEYRINLEFDRAYTDEHCSPVVEEQDLDRPGVFMVGGACYATSGIIWLPLGEQVVQGYSYPGYFFTGVLVDDQYLPDIFVPADTQMKIIVRGTTTWRVQFARAKRFRFLSDPVGLQILVDRSPVLTSPVFRFDLAPENDGECGAQNQLPVKTPLGIPPLCLGDFEFLPGSTHILGAITPQADVYQDFWVLDSFSNGVKQNGTFVVPDTVDTIDVVTAHFVKGISATILTTPPGLTLEIDGETVPPATVYSPWWGYGTKHRVRAPLQQKDKNGREWKFVGWGDGAPADREVVIPVGIDGYVLRAFYEPLGQIRITSNPSEIPLQINGATCVTPCTYNELPGAKLNMVASPTIALSGATRRKFDRWAGRPGVTSVEATFNTDIQFFHVDYHVEHQVQAYTDPENTGTFVFTPSSSDGYYGEGSHVQIKIEPKSGSKFLAWRGDIESRETTESFDMLGPVSLVAHMQKVPAIKPAGIMNAAGDNPNHTVAPGSIISIYGENLAIDTKVGPTNPLAQTIADIWVTVGDSILPLLFVSPTQINAQLLSTVPEGDHTLVVHNWGQPDVKATFKVKRNSPGVFSSLTKEGIPLVIALHEDGTVVTQDKPAHRGETITMFGTGLGPYNLPVVDGFVLPDKQLYQLLDPVKIMLQKPVPPPPPGTPAAENLPPPAVRDPQFVAGTAGLIGLTTVQVKIDPELPEGNLLELFLSIKDNESNRVQIPVE